jgi:ankyrin repeat protein
VKSRKEELDNENNIFLNKKMQKLDIYAFRGDNRPPEVIFNDGFTRQAATWKHFNANENKKIEEPTFRLFSQTWQGREKAEDIIPTSAVCVTLNFDYAPLFPLENPQNEHDPIPPLTWIYMVKVQQGFLTYELQRKLNSPLAFCEEVATRDIPPGDVICAIQCERFWNINGFCVPTWESGMHYQLITDVIWNPKLKNEIMTETKKKRNAGFLEFINQKKGKYWECPIPSQKNSTESLKVSHEISNQTHQDMNHLLKFAIDMENSKLYGFINKKEKEASALAHLKQCYDLNMFIPGMMLTPLMHACDIVSTSNNYEIIDYLLKNGASTKIKNSKGNTAFNRARSAKLQTRLVEFEAAQNNQTPLHIAAEHGYHAVVRSLLEQGNDVNIRDVDGYSPFHLAAQHGHNKLLKLLLNQKNLELNPSKNDYPSPLYIAAYYGHTEIVNKLLSNSRIAANMQDAEGKTQLHLAAQHGHLNALNVLLIKDADPTTPDISGHTPLHFAIENDNLDCVKSLLMHRIKYYVSSSVKLIHDNKNINKDTLSNLSNIIDHLNKLKTNISVKNAQNVDSELNAIGTKIRALEIDIDLHNKKESMPDQKIKFGKPF